MKENKKRNRLRTNLKKRDILTDAEEAYIKRKGKDDRSPLAKAYHLVDDEVSFI